MKQHEKWSTSTIDLEDLHRESHLMRDHSISITAVMIYVIILGVVGGAALAALGVIGAGAVMGL